MPIPIWRNEAELHLGQTFGEGQRGEHVRARERARAFACQATRNGTNGFRQLNHGNAGSPSSSIGALRTVGNPRFRAEIFGREGRAFHGFDQVLPRPLPREEPQRERRIVSGVAGGVEWTFIEVFALCRRRRLSRCLRRRRSGPRGPSYGVTRT